MQIWSGFYTVIAGASATLMGLLFVAVSLNSAAILKAEHAHSRRLAEQAFQNYVAVLTVSLLALFPSMSLSQFSAVSLVFMGLSGGWVLVRLYQAVTNPLDTTQRVRALRRQIFSLAGFGMLIYAAARMAGNRGDSRNLLASGVIVLLLAATRSSWVLLLSMAGPIADGF